MMKLFSYIFFIGLGTFAIIQFKKAGDLIGIKSYYVKHLTNKEMYDKKQIGSAKYLSKKNGNFIPIMIQIIDIDCPEKIQPMLD